MATWVLVDTSCTSSIKEKVCPPSFYWPCCKCKYSDKKIVAMQPALSGAEFPWCFQLARSPHRQTLHSNGRTPHAFQWYYLRCAIYRDLCNDAFPPLPPEQYYYTVPPARVTKRSLTWTKYTKASESADLSSLLLCYPPQFKEDDSPTLLEIPRETWT
jgi:hypothetical protein